MALLSADQLLAFLEAQGTEWVRRARLQYRPLGRPLTAPERVAIEPFFEAALLYSVRITNVSGVANPGFYSFLLEQSIAIPLDFTQMSAITFVDTILLSARRSVRSEDYIPLLFHELVHVVQCRELGMDEFVKRYVRGWVSSGFQYSNIPLERWAYDLEARFRAGTVAFDVAAEVQKQLG